MRPDRIPPFGPQILRRATRLNIRANYSIRSSKLQDTVSPTKSKREWHTTRLVEAIYPARVRSTRDRCNWIEAMMLDARLSDRDKIILTRLALHLNLKTGRCDPTIDLLALETSIPGSEETARRIVRRSIAQGDKLGWIERTGRHAGSRWNRSNSYRLRIPNDIHPDKFAWSSGLPSPETRAPESGRIMKELGRRIGSDFLEFENKDTRKHLAPKQLTVFVESAIDRGHTTHDSILEYADRLDYSLPPDAEARIRKQLEQRAEMDRLETVNAERGE